MIYKSNLQAPDMTRRFGTMLSCVRLWSFGHEVPSDAEFEPDCGSLTHDEAAILFACASRAKGPWLDIGCRLGWSAVHIFRATNIPVVCVDPALAVPEFMERFQINTGFPKAWTAAQDSSEYLAGVPLDVSFSGAMIDGNHDAPYPLRDAVGVAFRSRRDACIVFHDFWGQPIRDAVCWLSDNGWNARVFWTPNGMAVCWRGDFLPPSHKPDEYIRTQQSPDKFPDFDFSRLK